VRNQRDYLTLLIQARIGPETFLSDESIEKGSDMWLSPFITTSIGQCPLPSAVFALSSMIPEYKEPGC
jgi:hypothetical protein